MNMGVVWRGGVAYVSEEDDSASALVSFGAPVGHIRDRVPQKWVSRSHEGHWRASFRLRRLEAAQG